ILLQVRRPASSERGPQTGNRGAMSYAGLVLDLDDAERRHQLLDQVVLFVVQRRAAEIADREGALCRVALFVLLLPVLVAGPEDALDDHLHRVLERELLPRVSVRAAVLDLVLAQRPLHIVLRGGAFRAEAA